MSQPYRVVLTKTLQAHIRSQDRTVQRVHLDPLLPPDQMHSLLANALAHQGWQAQGPNLFTRLGPAGELMSFDLAKLEVTSTLTKESTIVCEKSVSRSGEAWYNLAAVKERVRQELAAELAQSTISQTTKQTRQRQLQSEVAAQLEAGEKERTRLINAVILEVYATALKQKARLLGEIVEFNEQEQSSGEYALTITIQE